MRGYDPVMQNIFHIRLRRQLPHGSLVLFHGTLTRRTREPRKDGALKRFNRGDSETRMPLHQARTHSLRAGACVGRNPAVPIHNKIAIWNYIVSVMSQR
jgi:hypothetical protein